MSVYNVLFLCTGNSARSIGRKRCLRQRVATGSERSVPEATQRERFTP
jgi:protein-tyrosine-phosphatase